MPGRKGGSTTSRGPGGLAALACVASVLGACEEPTPPGFVGLMTEAQVTTMSSETPTTTDDTTGAADSMPPDVISDLPRGGFGDVGESGGCADVRAEIARAETSIMLLIDQSNSMNQTFGGVTRWEAVRQSLFEPGGVVDTLQSDISFGMALYTNDNLGAPCPDLIEVPVALGNHAAMSTAYPPTLPNVKTETPTGEAMRQVAQAFAATAPDAAKAIVLATDGEPDTCAVPDGDEAGAKLLSLQAVYDTYAAGVSVFVIAVGEDITDLAHLQQVANLGVGKGIIDPDPAPYFGVNDPAALAAAFNSIVSSFVPCDFTIDGTLKVDLACRGEVRLDGELLECGVDWEVTSETNMRLLGGACDSLQDGLQHAVDAVFPCEVIDIL